MLKDWNKIGKIKAIILGVLAISNILIPIGGQEQNKLVTILMPLIFGSFIVPLITLFNVAVLGRKIKTPNWNDNPISLLYPLSFFQFGAFFFLIIGLSILIGNGIKFQIASYFGLYSISFGLGIFIGILISLNWKKLRIFYFIIVGVLIIFSFFFLLRSYTKDDDIIKQFTEKFELYTSTTDKIINQIDNIDFMKNIEYNLSLYDESLSYDLLRNYIYSNESMQLPKEKKNTIDSLLMSIDCINIDFVDKKYVKLYTDLRNWDLFHVKLVKIIDDSVLIDQYKDWEFLKEGKLPTNKKNWLYHLKDNWYIESRIQTNENIKEDYPFEDDLSTEYNYYKNKNLEKIGKQYLYKENNKSIYLKHGKWIYLDSNEYIIREEVYCFDTLKSMIIYEIPERKKIKTDSIISMELVNGEWKKEKRKEYIIE